MRNEHRQSAGSGLLLGMAAGAALGAASVVAMNQNPRQVKRTARKLAKGAEHAVTSWMRWSAALWNGRWTCNNKKGAAAWFDVRQHLLGRADGHFLFQMHIRAVVLISPRRAISIWMLQVTVMDLFTSLPVSTEAGRFLMVREAVLFSKSPVRVPS